MCLGIEEEKKCQPCEGFPKGWVFFFDDEKKNELHRGLMIIGPTGRRFRNAKGVQNVYKHAVCDPDVFYKYVGLPLDGTAKRQIQRTPEVSISSSSTPKVSTTITTDGARFTLQQLWDARCHFCDNCRKANCNMCDSCIRSEGSIRRTECCLRKVCVASI